MSKKNNLFVSFFYKLSCFFNKFCHWNRTFSSSYIRHDTICTEIIAPVSYCNRSSFFRFKICINSWRKFIFIVSHYNMFCTSVFNLFNSFRNSSNILISHYNINIVEFFYKFSSLFLSKAPSYNYFCPAFFSYSFYFSKFSINLCCCSLSYSTCVKESYISFFYIIS